MTEKQTSRDALDILLFIGAIGAFLSGTMVSGFMIFTSILVPTGPTSLEGISILTNAVSFFALAVCALPALYVSGRALTGRRPPSHRTISSTWLASGFLFPVFLILGNLALEQGLIPGFGPLAHFGAAVVPVFLAIVIVHRQTPNIPLRRIWGQILAGVWGVPLLALILEVILAIAILVGVFIGILGSSQGPGLIESIYDIEIWSQQNLFESFPSLFEAPWIIVVALAYVILIVPMVEEATKSIVIWPLLRRRIPASEAFFSGVLGGAGFALIEALLLTQPGPGWTGSMIARLGATFMHSFTAGLTCWGLAQWWTKGGWRRSVRAYFTSVALHGLWNVAAIGIGVAMFANEVPELSLAPEISLAIQMISGATLISLSVVALLGLTRYPHQSQTLMDETPNIDIDQRNP